MKKKFLIIVFSIFFFTLTGGFVFGNGMLVPSDLPPLSLQTQYITVNINNQVATVRVEETFITVPIRIWKGYIISPYRKMGVLHILQGGMGKSGLRQKLRKKMMQNVFIKAETPILPAWALRNIQERILLRPALSPYLPVKK